MSGRLSTFAAALVVARRDFVAILWSRSFIFFLIGPLFPLVVGAMASGVGQRVEATAGSPVLGVAMSQTESAAMLAAARRLDPDLGDMVPVMVPLATVPDGARIDAAALLQDKQGQVAAVLTGSRAAPALTGPAGLIESWRGPVALVAAAALDGGPSHYPGVTLSPSAQAQPDNRTGRMRTAQAAQTLMFLLTMLLAGMVLSNLVEEKANKIIEILAAAVPMDAVFLGKLFAMLAVSFVGIVVWGTTIGTIMTLGGRSLSELTVPAVGWPMFLTLGIAYFAMAYLLLGAAFLTIGSMASTVREVQTLSMPVTMAQLLVFFFASYAMASPGSAVERAAVLVPFSSPFAMLARAAQDGDLWQHALALGWQAAWVALSVKLGASLFRRKVMKSGPTRLGRARRGLFSRKAAPAR